MLYHIIAVVVGFDLSEVKMHVIELLSSLSNSSILCKSGIDLINTDASKDDHTYACLLQDFVIILEQMQLLIPSTMTHVQMIGLVDLLRLKIDGFSDEETKQYSSWPYIVL